MWDLLKKFMTSPLSAGPGTGCGRKCMRINFVRCGPSYDRQFVHQEPRRGSLVFWAAHPQTARLYTTSGLKLGEGQRYASWLSSQLCLAASVFHQKPTETHWPNYLRYFATGQDFRWQ